jgi:hypothetical protein
MGEILCDDGGKYAYLTRNLSTRTHNAAVWYDDRLDLWKLNREVQLLAEPFGPENDNFPARIHVGE